MNNIKFNKYNVTNGTSKAKVFYSRNISAKNGAKTITIYAKEYGRQLGSMFADVRNETDLMTDYFDTDKVTFYEGSSNYKTLDAVLVNWGK